MVVPNKPNGFYFKETIVYEYGLVYLPIQPNKPKKSIN